jgi:DNA-binding winged helix-turn-helix (wHTH) protein
MLRISNHLYDFGPFRVDPSQRVLLRSGTPVRLPPKTFEVLLALVESGGRVLTKEDLLSRVWPDSVVEEANLSHHVFALRKALSDDGQDARYIETVPKRGYRLAMQVQEVPDERTVPAPQSDGQSGAGTVRMNVGLRRRPLKLVMALAAILVAGTSAVGLSLRDTTSRVESHAIRSLAILPFEPLAGDPPQVSLGVGLADTLITRLAAVRKISIRPPSSPGLNYGN